VKCPVLAARRASHSQPLFSPWSESITSYVAFEEDERVGAHCATSPLSLGWRRSSHSFGSGAPSRWMRLGLYTSPYGSSAVPTQKPSLSLSGMGLGLPNEAGMESHAALETSTFWRSFCSASFSKSADSPPQKMSTSGLPFHSVMRPYATGVPAGMALTLTVTFHFSFA